jgi:GNAT superfamily N-acetyltransferase
VACAGGEVIGQLMITYEWSDWRNGNFWWIQSVYVRPDWRGEGVFRRLYQEVERQARQLGGSCGLRLYVELDNTRAQQVYARLGMRETAYKIYESDFVLSR